MDLVAVAIWLAAALGHHSAESQRIAKAAAEACSDVECVVDAVVYAHHESSMSMDPKPEAWDAKRGLTKGAWQIWGGPVELQRQAQEWVRMRDRSLAKYGDLRALAGATDAGRRVAVSRAAEAFALRWGFMGTN